MRISILEHFKNKVLFKLDKIKEENIYKTPRDIIVCVHYYNDCVERYYTKEIKVIKNIVEVLNCDSEIYYTGEVLSKNNENKNVFITKFIDMLKNGEIDESELLVSHWKKEDCTGFNPFGKVRRVTDDEKGIDLNIYLTEKHRDFLFEYSKSEKDFGFLREYGKLIRDDNFSQYE